MDLVNDCLILNAEYLIQKTIHVQPERTSILNIDDSEEDLLKNMHHKTRYNIKLAEKKGVEIREAKEADLEEWWNIMTETKKRDGFRSHSRSYYKKMLEIDIVHLLIAEFEGKIIAGNIVSFFGDTAVYIHGASSSQYRHLMAPYLLQWQAIKIAQEKGMKYYDFYGIDENKWPGVTRFKKGFGGEEINYPGAFDLIFYPLCYNGYKYVRKIRRLI